MDPLEKIVKGVEAAKAAEALFRIEPGSTPPCQTKYMRARIWERPVGVHRDFAGHVEMFDVKSPTEDKTVVPRAVIFFAVVLGVLLLGAVLWLLTMIRSA